jgi:hypothetical protein
MKFETRLIQLVLGMLVMGALMYPVAAYDPFSSNNFKTEINSVPITKITPSFDSGFKTNSLKIETPVQISTIAPLSTFSTKGIGSTDYFSKISKIEFPKISGISTIVPSWRQFPTWKQSISLIKLTTPTYKPISPKIEFPKISGISTIVPSWRQFPSWKQSISSIKLTTPTFKPISSTLTSVPKIPSYQRSSFSRY